MSALDANNDSCAERGPSQTDDPEAEDLFQDFDEFYRQHYAFVWRNARRMLAGHGQEDVEDLIQDTFTAAYRRFDSYNDETALPTTWLFGILRNVARNHARGERRRTRRRSALADHQRANWQHRANDSERVMAQRMVEDFLAELDVDKRAVFVLAELEGMSAREIARTLNVNPNTVSTRLRAARKHFCVRFELPRSGEAVRRYTNVVRERAGSPPRVAAERSRALLIAGLSPGVGRAVGGGILAFGKGLVATLAVVLAVVGVAGLRPRERETSHSEDRSAKAPVAVETRQDASPALQPLEVRLSEDVDAPAEAPRRRRRTAPPSAASEHTSEVVEVLRDARAELVAGRPEAALELLDRVPRGASQLLIQRQATRIAALCQLDRGPEARAIFEALADTTLDSSLLERLDHACW